MSEAAGTLATGGAGGAQGGAGGGGGAGQGGGGGGGATAGALDWLPEGFRALPEFAGMKGIDDLAKGYQGQVKLLGVPKDQLVRLPKNAEDKDGIAAYRKAIGVPDAPERYDFKPADGAPELDAGVVSEMRKAFLDEGVPLETGNKIFGRFTGAIKALGDKLATDMATQRAAAETELKSEFGADFDTRVRGVSATVRWLDEQMPKGLDGKPKASLAAVLEQSGLGNDPAVVRALDIIAKQLGEDTLKGGGGGGFQSAASTADAQAALAKFDGDAEIRKKLLDRSHPERDALLKQREALILKANGL